MEKFRKIQIIFDILFIYLEDIWNKLLFLVYSEWNDNENIYTKNSKQPEVKVRKATTIKSRKNANLVQWVAEKCVYYNT